MNILDLLYLSWVQGFSKSQSTEILIICQDWEFIHIIF